MLPGSSSSSLPLHVQEERSSKRESKSHGSAVPDLVLNCTVTIVHRRLGYTHMKCEPSVSCGCAGGAGNAAASGREGRFPASNAVCLLRVSAEKS